MVQSLGVVIFGTPCIMITIFIFFFINFHQMEHVISGIRDNNLKLTLAFGIGMHHAGLHERDRKSVEELFVNQKIQVCSPVSGTTTSS